MRCSCGYKFAGTKPSPFVAIFLEAGTADNIPLHFGAMVADVDIDFGGLRLKIRSFREIGLLMLGFDGMIGKTAIDIVAVNANAHGTPLKLYSAWRLALGRDGTSQQKVTFRQAS